MRALRVSYFIRIVQKILIQRQTIEATVHERATGVLVGNTNLLLSETSTNDSLSASSLPKVARIPHKRLTPQLNNHHYEILASSAGGIP